MKRNFLNKECFFRGVNYWASHAGTAMWSEWNPEVIISDLDKLSADGIEVLRVFPLWSDFQPITNLYGWAGHFTEASHGEKFLDTATEEGRAGISVECIDKFDFLLSEAEKRGLKVIVALLTGWMSGRCFVPPALEGKNLITDPFAIRWELRFVKYFVKRFKDSDTIIAWELGNECNCLGEAKNSDEAFLWSSAIADAVRSVDSTHPFLSGMHGLMSREWCIEDQAEICDILTVHPYPLFTEHCALDGLASPRAIMHSPAELTFYSDIGGKPCLVEEIGTLGRLMGGESVSADFMRANLFNAWAHSGLGLVWWCAFDQDKLTRAPYDWCDVERELGLYRSNGEGKRMLAELTAFGKVVKKLPTLPERVREATVVVDSSEWTKVFGTFMLAKRAGVEPEFISKNKEPKCSALYIFPSISGVENVRKRYLDKLLAKVDAGATLMITYDGGAISPFESLVGCESLGRMISAPMKTELDGVSLVIPREYALKLSPTTAEVVAYGDNGLPEITLNSYGKGRVIFVNAPIEKYFAKTPTIASTECGVECIYAYAKRCAGITSLVEKSSPHVSITVHNSGEGATVVLINNSENEVFEAVKLNGCTVVKAHYGKINADGETRIPAFDAVVFDVKKN